MKKWLLLTLTLSICLNMYHFGKDYWLGLFTPNEEDQIILGEMIKLVVDSEEYKKIAERNTIYALSTSVDRNKGGAYPYYYSVSVKTNQKNYIFYCEDISCANMVLGGSTYSRYSDNKPVLPLE